MSRMATVDRPMSRLASTATRMMAFGVAFGSIEVADPSLAEADKVKKAKKVLTFISKGARKLGLSLRKAVGKVRQKTMYPITIMSGHMLACPLRDVTDSEQLQH